MPEIEHINTGNVFKVSEKPRFHGGIWECGDQRFTDPTGTEYQALTDVTLPPTVGVIAFIRLFTQAERNKARELRATNPNIDDFWRQLEDPRTLEVVMALPSIQQDIEDTLVAVKAAGVDLDVAIRKAEILSGQVH